MKIKLLVLSLVLFAQNALADGYLRAQPMYLSQGSGSGEITTRTSRTLVDVGGGFVHSAGWTLGVLYATEAQQSTGSATSNRASFGPTLGWMKGGGEGPYVLATYFMSSTLDSYKGTGYEVDLGYAFPLGKFSLGVQMSYKRFKYTESGGSSLALAYEQEYVDPYFVVFVPL